MTPLRPAGPLLRFADVSPRDRARVGGKVMPLAKLAADGLPVPDGFVVPTDAFRRVLEELGLLADAQAVERSGDPAAAARLREQLESLDMPPWLAGVVDRASTALGGRLAVRSSATDEDGRTRSFAGQHHTSLGVAPDGVVEAVRRCWGSLYAAGALAYRGGAGPAAGSMAVLVQRMVVPRVAGVLFTVNPMTGSWHEMTVEATWGLAEGLVSGKVAPHWFLVRRPRRTPRPVQRVLARVRLQCIQEDIHDIEQRWVAGDDGRVIVEPVPAHLRGRTTLPPHDLRRLCRLGLRVEAHLGAPQDVEWAIDHQGRMWLVQARPVTTGQVPRARRDVLWTRRFLGERFPQPVTPLTWSLVQPLIEHFVAYPEVQRRYLGGGSALRLVDGRVYLNATVFAHLAFKLPGLAPPRFMLELLPPDEADAFRRRFAVAPDLSVYAAIFRTTFDEERWRRFAWNPLTNPEAWAAFEADLIAALPGVSRDPVSPTDALRLVEDQRELQRDYVGVHICSLLFANLFDQLLESLLASWIPDHAIELHAALATTPPGNMTLVVNRALVALAAQATPEDLARLESGEAAQGAFGEALDGFLREYGHRSEASWDVFTPRWRQDPALLAPLLHSFMGGDDPDDHAARQQAAFEAARERVDAELGGSWRGPAFDRVLRLLRTYLLLRENQRFRFEQLQWAQQRTLLWLGEHLVERGILDQAADVRFLAWDEIRGLVDGSLGTDGPATWVARRRQAHATNLEQSPPAFIRGDVAVPLVDDALRLQGNGISPGRVTGRVRVVRSLSDGEALQPGEVLVAPAVDPAWTPLFLRAGGVVLELGSRLSHGAVIAREYRVPAVVNVDRAATRLRDGQEVTVDGTRGIVFVHP